MNNFLNLGPITDILSKLGSNNGQQIMNTVSQMAGNPTFSGVAGSTLGTIGNLIAPGIGGFVGNVAGKLIGAPLDIAKSYRMEKLYEQDSKERKLRADDAEYINIPFNRYAYRDFARDSFQTSAFQEGGVVGTGIEEKSFWEDNYWDNSESVPEDTVQEEPVEMFGLPMDFQSTSYSRRSNSNRSVVTSIDDRVMNAVTELETTGVKVGSINTGKHNVGSKHYHGKAFDIPASKNGGIEGLTKLYNWLSTPDGTEFLKRNNLRVIDERFKPAGKVGTANHLHFEIL